MFQDKLQQLYQDPRFRKLSYQRQQLLVKSILEEDLAQDSRFISLSPEEKQRTYLSVTTEVIGKLKPALNSYEMKPLTPEDINALKQGLLADVPGTQDSYKRGQWLLERLEQGDQTAIPEAKGWITRNSVATNSLLVQIAAGAKDAIEMLFGTDQGFNSLALNSQDYQKMADAMMARMPRVEAAKAATGQVVADLATNLVETVGLNMLLVGGPGRAPVLAKKIPGLFTQKLWKSMELRYAAATTAKQATLWGSTMPTVADTFIGGGVVDLARSFPKLIETGAIQGPKEFTERVVTIFGEGVAFDLFFNITGSLLRYAQNPLRRAIKKFNPIDPATYDNLKDALGNLEPQKFAKFVNDSLSGAIPREIYDAMDPEDQAEYLKELTRIKTIFQTNNFDVNTPEGFRIISKAMGFDAFIDEATGKVKLFGPNGTPWAEFPDRVSAVSWFTKYDLDMFTSYRMLDTAVLGAPKTGRVRIFGTTDMSIRNLSNDDLVNLMHGGLHGNAVDKETFSSVIDEFARRGPGETTFRKVKVNYVSEEDFRTAVQKFGGAWNETENLFLVPETLRKSDTKKLLLGELDRVFGKAGYSNPVFSAKTTSLSEESLDLAMRRIGGYVRRDGEKIIVGFGGNVQELYDLGSANEFVWRMLLRENVVAPKEFATLFHRSTGFTLKHSVGEGGVDLWEVWAPGGKQGVGKLLFTANSLEDLTSWAPTFRIQLPDFILPDLVVRKGKLAISETVVEGPVSSLRKFLEDFGDPYEYKMKSGYKLQRTMVDGTKAVVTIQPGGKFLEVEWPSVGFHRKFDSMKELKDFLGDVDTKFDAVVTLAARKGFRVDAGPGGSLIFHDMDNAFSARSADEAYQMLAKMPDAYEGPELVQAFGKEFDDEFRRKIEDALADVEIPRESFAKKTFEQHKWYNILDSQIRPAQTYIEKIADTYNMPELRRLLNKTILARQYLGSQLRPQMDIINKMFINPKTGKVFKKNELRAMGRLLDYAPENWDKVAASLGFNFTEEQRIVLMNVRSYLESLGKKFKIDFLGFHQNYLPHIRKFSRADLMDIVTARKEAAIQHIFGAKIDNIPALEFLCRNARKDAVLNELSESDLLRLVTFYTEKGFKEAIISKPAEEFKEFIVHGPGKQLPQDIVSVLSHWVVNLSGITVGDVGKDIGEFSLRFTTALSRSLEKMAKRFGDDATPLGNWMRNIAEEVISTDVPANLNHLVTLSSLGFRPIKALTNTSQYLNAYAVYGRFALKAPEKLTNDVLVELFRRGILDDRIFVSASDDVAAIVRKFSTKALKFHQASEWATRGWAAIAAQDAFDDALDRLSKGIIGWENFAEMAHIDWLPQGTQVDILELLKKGNIEAARDRAAKDAVRHLFFDYSKENWPLLFKRGTLGRLYGKFGVYNANQLELERTLVQNGSIGNRLARLTRLIVAATALKNAFAAVGIKYNGFNITDPLSFTGGPLWSTLVDLSRANSPGSEGNFARYRLMRDWAPFIYTQSSGLKPNVPRLLIPGGVQMTYIPKMFEDLEKGDHWGAFLDALGAARTTEPLDSIQVPW